MENENRKNNFNWYNQEYSERFEMAAGSRKALLTALYTLMHVKRLNKFFVTSIKKIWKAGNEWKFDVYNFKTKELYKKHYGFAPAYVRNGIILP